MGRKRWRRGSLELLLLCVLFHAILGDGDVGCLFSESLCKPEIETCYNDLAFGRCLQLYGNVENEDLYRYNMEPEELELLRVQLEKLALDGYRWPHPYTQCVMQGSLYALRFRSNHDLEWCRRLKEHNRHQFARNDEIDEDLGSQPIAIVKFTPSDEDPHGDFADELYYPPGVQEESPIFQSQEPLSIYKPEYSYSSHPLESKTSNYQQSYIPNKALERFVLSDEPNGFSSRNNLYGAERNLNKKSIPRKQIDNEPYESYDYDRLSVRNLGNIQQQNYIDSMRQDLQDGQSTSKFERIIGSPKLYPESDLQFLPAELVDNIENFREQQDPGIKFDNDYERQFSRKYKNPNKLPRPEFLTKTNAIPDFSEISDRDIQLDSMGEEDDNEDDGIQPDDFITPRLIGKPVTDTLSHQNGIYTEGGLVQPFRHNVRIEDMFPTGIVFDKDLSDDLKASLLRRELAGFKRRERLDVKKPGPPFATNNYAFKTRSPPSDAENDDKVAEGNQEDEILHAPLVKKELNGENSRKNVDMDHVYIGFKEEFHTWLKGEHVLKEVGRLLGLEAGALTDIRVERAAVTFKVMKNRKGFNASDVVNRIDEIRGQLKDTLGVEVTRAGIGDKIKLPAVFEVENVSEMSSSFFGAMVAAGAAAAGAAAVVTLIIARRHAKSRSKLAGLTAPDPEASKDYQDLCRARMQAKQPNDKPDSPRIISLSRESESNNSPSSRSSTSSWSEEPALSNMDISTGHMVLSYMEDHLKNKDRLDQEWTALCAYEAEPSSTAIAEDKANTERNRPGAAFPYDHSRVVLNDLANINSSDYINASTITDHDPRNPAYIATQGSLPQTAADFWQLVWEQGSVVIVMLTRLTEEGRAMCHRYWPEEGSELYHIYEVHLVSEHIWCDDYLVRSFYLKNLRTGETRTVTQFHFLSWPENGVPHSTKALLEFRRKVNKSYRGRSCPIVVHCSDGAGRTGTYCLIDMVLNRMAKGAKEIDIAATLEHIRDQRPGMVATKQQFEFVLMAVAEEVHAILKALPIPPAEKSPAPTTSNALPPAKTDQ